MIDKGKVETELIYSKRGNLPVYKMMGYLLHSKYDPIKEAKRFVELHYRQHYLHILFGYGNGYIVEEFKKKISENEVLLVIEPNKFLKDKIQGVDKATDNFHLIFDENLEEFQLIFENYIQKFPKRVQFIISPNYDKIFPDYHLELLKKTNNIIQRAAININTINFFAHDWQKNYLSNLFHAFEDVGINHLEKKTKLPIIIASGGPSLTKQLALLKKVKDKAIIICAGSTINTLLKNGIRPDIVVTIDGSILNYNHFKDNNIEDIFMIYSLLTHHKIVDEHHGNKAFFIPNTSMNIVGLSEQLINKTVPYTFSGGSVANFSLFLAHQITSGPICFIGQDLAYTNNQTHAEHNRGYHEVSEEEKRQRKMFKTEGYYGDEVLTDFAFYSMKNTFEEFVKIIDDNDRLFNCTEGGVRINGLQQLSFQNYIETYLDQQKDNLQEKIFLQSGKRSSDEWETFLGEIEKEMSQYKRAIDNCHKALQLLKRNKSREYFEQSILKNLNKCDQRLNEHLKSGIMHYLLQPVVHQILHEFLPKEDETQKEMYERVFKRSVTMYESIENSSKETISYLNDLRRKIKEKLKNK